MSGNFVQWIAIPAGLGFLVGAWLGQWMVRDSQGIDFFKPLKRERLYAYRHHGKYVAVEHLDEPSRRLAERADTACTAVLESRVHRAGLLDEIANQVVLPEELWRTVALLQRQSILEVKQAEARALADTPQLEDVLEPQQRALAVSRASVITKIEALEEYARRVALADSVYAAGELSSMNEEYLDLLAQTDDRTAIDDLSADAVDLHSVLADVHEAAAFVGPTAQ
jgi:hypothetical protein